MERYETAIIEVEQFDEDVITASVANCAPIVGIDDNGSQLIVGWAVTYSDGTRDMLLGEDSDEDMPKPDECP